MKPIVWRLTGPLLAWVFVFVIAIPGDARAGRAKLEALFALQKPGGTGPFPAVVLVSGCSGFSGFGGPRYDRAQARLRQLGFVTIRVDYVGARDLESCHPGYVAVTKDEVVNDIFHAIAHLNATGFVKASAINLLGWSYGGGSTLLALGKLGTHPDVEIAAVANYYPACQRVFEWSAAVPVLLLYGGLDTIAAPSLCRYVYEGKPAARHVRAEIYPGARHGFDIDELPEQTKYRFGVLGFHPEAARKSWQAVETFLVR